MGGQQSKRSDAAFGVEVNVVPQEGYRVRVAPELEDILLRRNQRCGVCVCVQYELSTFCSLQQSALNVGFVGFVLYLGCLWRE